jgi:hypothetical protein
MKHGRLIDGTCCFVSLLALSFNLLLIKSVFFGTAFFAIYVFFASKAIRRWLPFFEGNIAYVFAFLLLNLMLGLESAIAIGLSIPLTDELLIIFLALPLVFFVKKDNQTPRVSQSPVDLTVPQNRSKKNYPLKLLIAFIVSLGGMLVSLCSARTGSTVQNIQANLSPVFYIFVFCAGVSAAALLFTRISLRLKLAVVGVYSLVLFSFRYIIYVVIWGSDSWDNLVTAWWLHNGGVLQARSSLYFYIARSDNSYLSLWGIDVSFSRITGINLFTIYPYIGILVAILVPIVLYYIVKTLLNNTTVALAVSLLSSFLWDTFLWLSLPYANSYGILCLLFSLLFWVMYLKTEKISLGLPVLVTIAALFAYPLTGFYAVFFGVLSVLIKRGSLRKWILPISIPLFLFLPLYDIFIRVTNLLSRGLFLPLPSFLSIDQLLSSLFFEDIRSFPNYGYNLSPLLNIPYLVIYFLAGVGLFLGRRKVRREIFVPMLTIFLSLLAAETYGWWVQNIIYHRIGATVLPWFLLIFASMSLDWFYAKVKEVVPPIRISYRRLRKAERTSYLISPKKFAVFLFCLICALGSTANFVFYPTQNQANVSTDLVHAVNYVISASPARDQLIFTDIYTIKLIGAYSQGPWYNYPYGDRLDEFQYAVPYYNQILSNQTTVLADISDGRTAATQALQKMNVTCDFKKFFIIYDESLCEYMYNYLPLSSLQSLPQYLSSVLSPPVTFGDVYVYSGYFVQNATYGTTLQLDDKTLRYNMVFPNVTSLPTELSIKGSVLQYPQWGGLLVLGQNSSLTINVNAEHNIINASLSCSVSQYSDNDTNLIQVSVDDSNWISIWKVNSTLSYSDINGLQLPQIVSGHSSFYLRFYSEYVNANGEPSLAIRSVWNNAQNGLQLTILCSPTS